MTVAPPQRASWAASEPTPAEHAVDQHQFAVDGAVGEDGAVRGDAGDAQARAEVVGQVVGQWDGEVAGDDGVLGGGAEGAVGLGAVHPHARPDVARVDAVANGVDDAGGVGVRDHPRIGHGRADPAATLLGVAGIGAGDGDADTDLTGAGGGVGQLTELEHFGGRAPAGRTRTQACSVLPMTGVGLRAGLLVRYSYAVAVHDLVEPGAFCTTPSHPRTAPALPTQLRPHRP